MNPRSFLFIYPRIRCSARHFSISSSLRNQANQEEKSSWVEKIGFSTYLEQFIKRPSFRQKLKEKSLKPAFEAKAVKKANKKSHSVALQFYSEDPNLFKEEEVNEDEDLIEGITGRMDNPNFQFPYKIYTEFSQTEEIVEGAEEGGEQVQTQTDQSEDQTPPEEWIQQYGIPDPTIPASNVPCGGCGAYLHCQDAAIPGYMPSERFRVLKDEELKTEVCQRCFFLKVHNAALSVNVSPKIYPEILKTIEKKKALVLLMVDMVDFPCSIWPGIADIIGWKRPVILVGNKVDLIPRDSKKYLERMKTCLRYAAEDVGFDKTKIVHVALISAATGYGIEDLITAIHNSWGNRGDIYIMGCTNVGKSTLFNVFLQSDLCKVQAVDLVQRATVSAWPGTTLNLLKFPVLIPDGWKQHLRIERLKRVKVDEAAERKLREFQLKQTHNAAYSNLIGYVGLSYNKHSNEKELDWLNRTQDLFQVNPKSFSLPKLSQVGKWDPHDPQFAHGKWCFDTPGTVNENQILDKLVLPELMKILPKKMVKPRSYYLKSGLTMFVAGLVRIDNISEGPVTFTVFTSSEVPLTIVDTVDAEEVYHKALGTPVFGVPMGDQERLDQFPPLKPRNFEVVGEGKKFSCSDIVLSAIGWVAVTADRDQVCKFSVHTLNGAGVFLRKPALLPYMVNTKGARVRDTPAYCKHEAYIPDSKLFY